MHRFSGEIWIMDYLRRTCSKHVS